MLQTYLTTNHNWNNDKNISVYYSTISSYYEPNYSSNYLEKITLEMKNNMNSIMPNSVSNITSVFSLEFYHKTNLSLLQKYQINAFHPTLTYILLVNLIEGRLPNNSSEILYYKETSTSTAYHINDIVTLQATNTQTPLFSMNYSVVGIIDNLETSFSANNFSVDVLDWQNKIASHRYIYDPIEKFFTTSLYLTQIANDYPVFQTGRAIIIDFDYTNHAIQSNKINKYLSYYQKNFVSFEKSTVDPQETFVFGIDIYNALITFRNYWLQKSVIAFSLTYPLIILVTFLSIESFNYNQKDYLVSFGLLHSLGIKKRLLFRIVSLEVLGISIFSFLIGFLISILVGLPLFFIFHINSFQEIYSFFIDPLFLCITFSYSIFYLILGFVIELKKVKKIPSIKSLPFTYYEKNKFQNFFSKPEILLIPLGSVTLPIGIFLLRASYDISATYIFLRDIALGLIFFGLFIITLALIFIVSRLIVSLFSWISTKAWNEKKNIFSFSLRNIKFSTGNYNKVISLILIISMSFFPGIILHSSINKHISVDNSLSLGCGDIILQTNSPSFLPSQIEILNISGIEKSTLLTITSITLERSTLFGEKQYTIPVLSLHNQTEFTEIIDLSLLDFGFTANDILDLNQNLSFLLNKKYVAKNNYNPGIIFSNELFGDVTKNLALHFINSFNFFPLLPQRNNNPFNPTFENNILFSVVTNLNTSLLLENTVTQSTFVKTYIMMIKTAPEVMVDEIKNFLSLLYPFVEVLDQDSISDQNEIESMHFTLFYLTFSSIVSFLIAILYGYITTTNILNFRNKAIEIEYTIGVSKRKIISTFLLEVTLIAIIPIIISIVLGIYFGKFVGIILTSNYQTYLHFNLKFSGLFILAIIMSISSFVIGWLLGVIPHVKNYRLVKEM
ncbi:MAG: ABC transporter permease [Candidatus Heimdallarchaeota archaeon]|nr:ABC transporter permease [Candidatus Heimdallarchaeota archaeon]